MTESERKIAEDILRLMVQDASLIVREALSYNLQTAKLVPHDVALSLANDIDTVALPFLEFSDVLTEGDLIDIVKRTGEGKQTAIARRKNVSIPIADALVATENAGVVRTLVSNKSATISAETLDQVVDQFGDDESFHAALVERTDLSVTIAERLVARVSDQLRDYLVTHHELSADTAAELVLNARERATVDLAGMRSDDDLERMVEQLHVNGRLTPSLILRTLCTGDVAFFEASMARLAHTSLFNARLLVHDKGQLGLKSLYDRASLPPSLYPAVRLAFNILRQTDFQSGDYDRESFSRKVLERILTDCEQLGEEDAEYLLRRLNDIAPGYLQD